MATTASNLAQLSNRKTQTRWYTAAVAVVLLIVALRLLLHLLTANRYGIFRDEMYYLACASISTGATWTAAVHPAVTWLFTTCSAPRCWSFASSPRSRAAAPSRSPATRASVGGRRFAMGLAALAARRVGGVRHQRPPAGHQRFRSAVLDGLCVGRHPHHPDRQSEAVAVVRRARWHRPDEQVFDGGVRPRHRRRGAADTGAQGVRAKMDLAGRRRWRSSSSCPTCCGTSTTTGPSCS